MIYTLGDRKVQVPGDDYFIADSADVIGDVRLAKDASIWFNCVVRGDTDTITIGEGTNIQDGTVMHADHSIPCTIGAGVTVGHMVMLHGCEVGEGSLIGMNAVILNNAKVGKNCLIGANAFVAEGKEIPDNSVVFGAKGEVVRQVSDKHMALMKMSALHYVENYKRFKRELAVDERFQ